jgi:hypothetical protein
VSSALPLSNKATDVLVAGRWIGGSAVVSRRRGDATCSANYPDLLNCLGYRCKQERLTLGRRFEFRSGIIVDVYGCGTDSSSEACIPVVGEYDSSEVSSHLDAPPLAIPYLLTPTVTTTAAPHRGLIGGSLHERDPSSLGWLVSVWTMTLEERSEEAAAAVRRTALLLQPLLIPDPEPYSP